MTSKKSAWWKDICKVDCSGQGTELNWFDRNVQWKLEDVKRVKFWVDCWIDGQLLKVRFSCLYLMYLCKESVVDDVGS